jgi:hypothetical protein
MNKFPRSGTFDYWATVTNIKDMHEVLIAKGCFVYKALGIIRHSSFCVFLQPHPNGDIGRWEFSMCPVGNDDY